MNNYERIYDEIAKETEALASVNDLESQLLLDLIMEIVDLEDQNRTKRVPRINQQIQEKILLIAQNILRIKEEGNVEVP